MGREAAARWLDADISPSTVYVRADPAHVDEVRAVLGATANPENPEAVNVQRPSDAIEARAAAATAFTALFLGLGAVALGVAAGMLIGGAYGTSQDWPIVMSPVGIAIGVLAAALVGAVAGLYRPCMPRRCPRRTRCGPLDRRPRGWAVAGADDISMVSVITCNPWSGHRSL